jgi:hypothetical protein
VRVKPPPFENFVFLGELGEPEDKLRAKILSGQMKAYIYSTLARGDFEPVPISAAAFSVEEDKGWESFSDPEPQPVPYQIMVVDCDTRRPSMTRRHIRVPHWVYVARKDLPTPKQPRVGSGAPEIYDWDDIEQFIRNEFTNRGDFLKPENKMKGWRSQNDLIELVKDYLQRRNQPIPGDTQMKKNVSAILKTIRPELPTDH